MKRYSISELEALSELSFDDAIEDFYDDCIRTGHHNMYANAEFFVRENDLRREEFYRVLEALERINSEHGDSDE